MGGGATGRHRVALARIIVKPSARTGFRSLSIRLRVRSASRCLGAGAGLASWAAWTVATVRALAPLGGARLAPRQLAAVAYRAEHDHVGVKCGVMDQTISALARPGHALLLECATLAVRQIPFRGRL